MNKVTRYSGMGSTWTMPNEDGDYVKYKDYAELDKKLTDIEVQLANAESKCRWLAERTVTLPEALNSYGGMKIYRPKEVVDAIRAAGIGVKGE